MLGRFYGDSRTRRAGALMVKGNMQLPDASHICKNKMCVSPLHVIFETRQHNLRRDCCNKANAFACRCPNAKCIFVRRGRTPREIKRFVAVEIVSERRLVSIKTAD